MLTFLRYIIVDYERLNFSISQCSWDPGTQENIVAIESPANSEANEEPIAGTSTSALNPGHIAGVVAGSTVGLLLIIFLVLMGKKKLTANLDAKIREKAELAANDNPFLHEDEAAKANMPELEGGGNVKREIDDYTYPSAELEAKRDIQEMKSNEEVGYELAISNLQVSELPS